MIRIRLHAPSPSFAQLLRAPGRGASPVRGLLFAAAALALVLLAGCAPVTPPPDYGRQIVEPNAQEVALLAAVNEARTQGTLGGQPAMAGSCRASGFTPGALRPVSYDGEAAHAALMHAGYLATTGTPQGDAAHFQDIRNIEFWGYTPQERLERSMREYGYGTGHYRQTAENITAGDFGALEAVRNWLLSPLHCEAMLDPDFTHAGAGYAPGMRTLKPQLTPVPVPEREIYPHNWVLVLTQR